MTPIRRLAWTSLALVAMVGCDIGVQTPTGHPATGGTAGNATGGTAGTSTPPEPKAKAPTEIKPLPVPDQPGEPKGASAEKLTDDEIANIKKLPADEQALALAQKVCPVSEGHLGMEVPIKKVVNGKTFFLCCSSCEKDVAANPDKVLADLEKLKK